MKENVLLDKSFALAVRIVKAYKYLAEEKKEFILYKATSTKRDFNGSEC